MKIVQSVALNDSREELLPDFSSDFPYIATCAQLDRYREPVVPWHWHRAVELFYMESGTLEYTTPHGKWVFPAGSGGMVSSNVLHSSQFQPGAECNVQLLHLFDPSLLSGGVGSRMEEKYILPLMAAVEMIPLFPEEPKAAEILEEIRKAFSISEDQWGYEFQIREALVKIWLQLYELACPAEKSGHNLGDGDAKIKELMVYIHEHYQEPISVEQLSKIAHISERACYRLFREHLHTTPVEYIRSFRLQKACQMLKETKESVTQIAYHCGFGSGSYFGKVFREVYGCSPWKFRQGWQDRNKK